MREDDILSLPKGWEIKKLGEVCEKTNNIKWVNNERELEYIDLSSVSREKLVVTKSEKITEFNAPSRAKKIVLEKDVIFATTRPTLKRVAIINRQYTNQICSTGFCILRPKEIVEEKWIFSFIQTDEFMNRMEKLQRGASYPAVTDSDVKNTLIPIPPLPEQKRIVFILDRAFEAIDKAKANAEQNLKNTKELFESYLQRMFENKSDDWTNSTIGKTCNLITGGTPSRSKSEYFKNGTINWLVFGDINKKTINECDGKITELGLENSNAKFLPLNSVMIALNGQGKTRGTVAILKIKATCNQSLVSIYSKDDNKILPELIFSNLQGRYNEIRKITGDSGNDRRGLNMPLIKEIKFSYPKSLDEQQQIVQKLDTLSTETKKLESIYQQKIADLDELKKSILQKAFAGELK